MSHQPIASDASGRTSDAVGGAAPITPPVCFGNHGDIGRDLGPDDFQIDTGILKKLVLRLINLAHPTTSNETNNRKAAGDELSGLEAPRGGERAQGGPGRCSIRGKGGSRKKAGGARILKEELLEVAACPGRARLR